MKGLNCFRIKIKVRMCYDHMRRPIGNDDHKPIYEKCFYIASETFPSGGIIEASALEYVDSQDDIVRMCELIDIICCESIGQFI
jgi:hypothetical protein